MILHRSTSRPLRIIFGERKQRSPHLIFLTRVVPFALSLAIAFAAFPSTISAQAYSADISAQNQLDSTNIRSGGYHSQTNKNTQAPPYLMGSQSLNWNDENHVFWNRAIGPFPVEVREFRLASVNWVTQNEIPNLEDFRRSVTNGRADQLTGLWVEGVLAFKVLPGTSNTAPSTKDTVSIYNWAEDHGVTGFLIHDYLGGTRLYHLNPGVRIAAIYGNGGVDRYVSRGGTWYESKTYTSRGFKGPFRIWSCVDCSFDVTVQDIRWRHYTGAHRLAFQTCVTAEGRIGLMIVEAYLTSAEQLTQKSYLLSKGIRP